MSDVFAFGDLQLDPDLYQLRRGAAPVPLEPKVFDVLAYLVRHRERVVSKNELLAELWRGEHVSESVLPRCVTAARKAVGDSARSQQVIQTVHGRGYRFVAAVAIAPAAPHAAPSVTRGAATVARDGTPAAAGGAGAAVPGDVAPPAARGGEVATAARDAEVAPLLHADDPAAEPPRGVFVGRDAAMAELRSALEAALGGHGRLALLLGEPGIGKTRTAEELAADARGRGARVFTGRCYEGDGAPAFWPWVQIVRAAVAAAEAPAVLARLGAAAHDLTQLAPDLHAGTAARRADPSATPAASALAPEQARFRLFDSVSALLKALAAARPLVLVLDDLHWADKPSLLLLQFLAREMRDARILLVGTYRDVELRRDHPLAATLGELAREPISTRIALRGLVPADVARVLEATTGAAPAERTVTAIAAMTEGNPFFIGEIVRLLAARGQLDAPDATWATTLPQGVREAIGRRLSALSETCNRVLALAAVLGREFRLNVLHALADLDRERLLEALNEAVDARILVASGGDGAVSRYAFTHALIRETLYEEMPVPLRVRVHRRGGEVLERVHEADRGPYLSELAHHFYQAAAGGEAEKAIVYATAAAARASRSLAYEEAAGHLERALDAVEFTAPVDETRRCELLLALGEARTRASERAVARRTFARAADVARALGRPDLLTRAALGFGGRAEFGVGPDAEVRALLDEALTALPREEIALRSRLLSRMTGTEPWADSMDRRAALSTEAVALARRAGDTATLVEALNARHWAFLGPDHLDERRVLGDELLALAEAAGEKAWAFAARDVRFTALLGLGDIAGADRELDALRALAAELRQPIEQWFVSWFQASRATGDGRFEEGERHIREGLAIGERAQHPAAQPSFRGQLLWLRGEQGRSEDIAEVEAGLSFLLPLAPATRTVLQSALVNLHVDQGRSADARREFAALAAHDFRDIERNEHWLVTMAMAAESSADLGDARRGALVYELLRPFATHNVVHDLIRAYRGSVSLYLALAATAMRAWDAAAGHFEDALVQNARMGTRPYVARAEYEYARMLLTRERKPDRGRVRALLAGALATARALGMKRLETKVAATRVPR